MDTQDTFQESLLRRQSKGHEIAASKKVKRSQAGRNLWIVPSQTHAGSYIVDLTTRSCTCPDFESLGGTGRDHKCKHLYATLYVRREIPLPNGNSVVFQQQTHINYPRDWRATNLARTKIPQLGPTLLADLIKGLGLPTPTTRGRGRPAVPASDVLLTAALRVFGDCTAGAAVVDAENYKNLGFFTMSHVPSYNTLLREFAKPSYMPWLHKMIAGSAWPLIRLESKFAIDGTGFGTCVYDCYQTEKHGSELQKRMPTPKHRWVSAKLVHGTTTHVIAAVQITEANVAECPLMPELMRRTTENGGRISEWLADAAYMSWYNAEAVEKIGATAYIDFPKHVTGVTKPAIKRLHSRLQLDEDDYRRHYHQRSFAETGHMMMKTRFSHRLRSRVPNAQYAEAMLLCVCHNVACLVQAVEELGIEPKYWSMDTPTSPETLQ